MDRRNFLKSVGALVPASVATTLAAERQSRRPVNLLFVITDQQRFDALSCAGNPVLRTTNLDRLAREGAMFRNAMTNCPVCVPARTCILTGNSIENTHVHNNGILRKEPGLNPGPSFDNILAGHGYHSQYYGKYHSPYTLARTYDNKVIPIVPFNKGQMTEKTYYRRYLDQYVPVRKPGPGELIDPGSERPYTPALVDYRYALRNAPLAEREKVPKHMSQAEVWGWLHVPRQHSLSALTVDDAIRALGQLKNGPFSLTCSIGPPHPPFLNHAPYWGMYPADEMPLPKNFRDKMTYSPYRNRAAHMTHFHKPENVRSMMSVYYGMVKEDDDQIGRLLKRLEELGLAGNTLVIFTADHGEMLGSHGMHSKMVFYEGAVHVPLLMRLPGVIKPGTVVTHPVSTMDLFPTILDYLGQQAPPRDGRDLRPLIEGRKSDYPDFCVSEWAANNTPNYMVRTEDWKLMMANRPESTATDALYNLKEDPYEMRNLLGPPADRAHNRKRAEEMKERLVSWLERVHSPHLEGVKQRTFA